MAIVAGGNSGIKKLIETANQAAVRRIDEAIPVLVDIAPAGQVISDLTDRMVLHSGPPIGWHSMCGAQKGSLIGIALFEGWAHHHEEAIALYESGKINLEPNHHHGAVGPMAGTISRSMPVWIVENRAFGNRAFCRPVDGRQQFGDFSESAIEVLLKWRDILAPTLRKGIKESGGVELKPIISKALNMGDEMHNRPVAASSLFGNIMAAALIRAGVDREHLLSTVDHIVNDELLFLSLSMAAAKAAVDSASEIEYSTVVTAMARNGIEFGIRVSGLGDEWFTAPAPYVKGLFLPGFHEKDAGADMGDSAITETVGWAGFAIAGAPGHLSRIGGTYDETLKYDKEMREITVGCSLGYRMPALGFQGVPVGIDIRKVVYTGISPIIDTGIAHKDPGYSIIGAGMVRAPMECFKKALRRFGKKYAVMAD